MKKVFFMFFVSIVGSHSLRSMDRPGPISSETFEKVIRAVIQAEGLRLLGFYSQGQNSFTQQLLEAIVVDDEDTVYEILEAVASQINISHAKIFAIALGSNKCKKALALYEQ